MMKFSFDRWNEFRAKQAIDKIVGEGLAWVDEQSEEKSYWFPSLFPKREQATAWTTSWLVEHRISFKDVLLSLFTHFQICTYFSILMSNKYIRWTEIIQLLLHLSSSRLKLRFSAMSRVFSSCSCTNSFRSSSVVSLNVSFHFCFNLILPSKSFFNCVDRSSDSLKIIDR